MPFTPLHMGPGLAIKAVAGRHFSIVAFGIAQVAMDLEPLIGLFYGSKALHGPTHTYLAALIFAAAVAIVAPPASRLIFRRLNYELSFHGLAQFAVPEPLARAPFIAGAFIGTVSHVFLDSIMHADMSPLAPWSNENLLQGVVSIASLDWLCLLSGVLGLVIWLMLFAFRRTKAGKSFRG